MSAPHHITKPLLHFQVFKMSSAPAKSPFNEKELDELKKLFKKHDKNSDGRVDKAELFTLIKSTGEDVTADMVAKAIAEFDTNGDKALDFKEFMSLMIQLRLMDKEQNQS
ncbi:hypothetical protein BGZ70_005588 [Mortierella alpina]|uniref:Calcineurin subunit B n=1 Tax=Mortierella alpina TaxID=64518 RepID=A0A9P6JC55_MORAP|nr:hypothetical protein BGZ70_005588 [Mortierella alpina]